MAIYAEQYMGMSVLIPSLSTCSTEESAADYDRWFRTQVEASLADTRPSIPHEQVMAEMDDIIARAERRASISTAPTSKV